MLRSLANITDEEIAEAKEQFEVLRAIRKARKRGDRAAELELNKKFLVPAESLMAIKKSDGPEWIRERCYNTKKADEKYGPGWLDR